MNTASRARCAHRLRPFTVAGSERGSATAELAIILPAVMLLLAALLFTGHAVHTQLQCAEAARVAARVIALGEAESTARTYVHHIAGSHANLQVHPNGDGALRVEVSRHLIVWSSSIQVRSDLLVPWEPNP